MKVLITGDFQLESNPSHDRRNERGSIRFEENVETISKMIVDGSAAGCEMMVFLGDLTEERNPDSKTMEAAAYLFSQANRAGMKVRGIAGNHDGAIYEISSSSLAPLAHMADVDKFKVYHEIKAEAFPFGHFVYLPYLHDTSLEKIHERLKSITDLDGDLYLFGHYAVQGTKIGAKNMALPGDYLDAGTLCAQAFRGIFMGHIHKAQTVKLGEFEVKFPGSPYVCDFGERNDLKGYIILDTDTGKSQWFEIKPRRQWLYFHWDDPKAKWGSDDLVKFIGECERKDNPSEHIRRLIKDGKMPEPFYKSFEVIRKRPAKPEVEQAPADDGSSGFRNSVANFISRRWPDNPKAIDVRNLVLENLSDAKKASGDKLLVPVMVQGKDFMSHASFRIDFESGEPFLIIGSNGEGKTNILEAILFGATGETSKQVQMSQLIRQGAKKAWVNIVFRGATNFYAIERTVASTAKTVTHKVKVSSAPTMDGPWTSLADGGVKDTQDILTSLLGASFVSLKATNFMFQKDPSPFINALPSERKAILGEILGFEPMAKAYKVLTDKRLEVQRLVQDIKMKLTGMREAFDPDKKERLAKELVEAEDSLSGFDSKILAAETELGNATTFMETIEQALGEAERGLASIHDSSSEIASAEQAIADLERIFTSARERRVKAYREAKKTLEDTKAELEKADISGTNKKCEEATALSQKTSKEADSKHAEWEGLLKEKLGPLNSRHFFLESESKRLTKEKEDLQSNDIGKCSKCGHEIDSKHIEAEIAKTTASLESTLLEMETISKEIITATKECEAAAAEHKRLTDLVKSSQEEANLCSVAINLHAAKQLSVADLALNFSSIEKEGVKATEEHDAQKLKMSKALDALREKAKADGESRTKMKEKISGISLKLGEAKTAVEGQRSQLSAVKEKKAARQSDVSSLKRSIAEHEDLVKKISTEEARLLVTEKDLEIKVMACEVLDPKSGLPVYLIDTKIPDLEDSINRYMEFFGTGGLYVSLETKTDDGKETLAVLVDNGWEPRLDVAVYSGGQLDRIEVCLKMSLADLAEKMRDTSLGLLAFDEPGVHLDEARKTKLIELINERATSGRTPVSVVISHDRKLMIGFRRRFSLVREEENTLLIPV